MFLIMKLLYLKQKMKLGCIAAIRGQLHDFEDSRCFFLSIFCFLLDILRQKVCQGVEPAFPRPRMRVKIKRKPWSVPRLRGGGEQG
jgi:hypothetical protein